jgi:hypothetical protein
MTIVAHTAGESRRFRLLKLVATRRSSDIRGVNNIGRTKSYSLILPSRRLLVVGSVRRIIGGLYFREPFQAGGVDLCDPVLEGGAFDLIFDIAITQDAFQG